jgi:competence transcription factor ComK
MFMGATAMTYPVPQDEAVSSSDSDDDDEDDEDEEGEAVLCTDKSQELCVVCMIRCVDTVLVPCGHACMCRRCAKRVKRMDRKCPICRVPIERILVLHTISPNFLVYHTGIKQ